MVAINVEHVCLLIIKLLGCKIIKKSVYLNFFFLVLIKGSFTVIDRITRTSKRKKVQI